MDPKRIDNGLFFSDAALSEIISVKTEFLFEYKFDTDVLISEMSAALRFEIPQILEDATAKIQKLLIEQVNENEAEILFDRLRSFCGEEKSKVTLTTVLNTEEEAELSIQKLAGTNSLFCVMRINRNVKQSPEIRDDLSGLIPQFIARKILSKEIGNHYRSCLDFLMLDVDCLKQINDTFGHPFGDKAIKSLGQKIQELLGPGDLAFRLGGDEFAVLRVGNSFTEDEIKRYTSLRIIYVDEIPIGVSMGRASGSKLDFDTLYRLADSELYEAKKENRSLACFQTKTNLFRNSIRDISDYNKASVCN